MLRFEHEFGRILHVDKCLRLEEGRQEEILHCVLLLGVRYDGGFPVLGVLAHFEARILILSIIGHHCLTEELKLVFLLCLPLHCLFIEDGRIALRFSHKLIVWYFVDHSYSAVVAIRTGLMWSNRQNADSIMGKLITEIHYYSLCELLRFIWHLLTEVLIVEDFVPL